MESRGYSDSLAKLWGSVHRLSDGDILGAFADCPALARPDIPEGCEVDEEAFEVLDDE